MGRGSYLNGYENDARRGRIRGSNNLRRDLYGPCSKEFRSGPILSRERYEETHDAM